MTDTNPELMIPPEPDSTLPLLSVVRMVWKQAGVIALVTVALSVVIILGVYRLPLVYRAEVTLLADSQKIPEKFVSSTVESELQDRVASLSQQILSSTRLVRIIEEHNLYSKERARLTREELVDRMRGDIDITVEKGFSGNKASAFRVAYQGSDPRTVATVANQVGTLFVEENFRSREVQAAGTTDFLRSQLAEAKKSLDEQEARVSAYKLRNNGQLPQQEQALMASLNQLRVQLQGHQDAISRAYQNRVTLQNAQEAVVATQETLSRMEESSARAAAAAADAVVRPVAGVYVPRPSAAMEAELAIMRQRLREAHPDLRAMEDRIVAQKALERKDEEARKRLLQQEAERETEEWKSAQKSTRPASPPRRPESTPEQRQKVKALQAQLAELQKEIDSRQQDASRTALEISSVEARLQTLPVREQEMAALTRDYENSKANYKSLLDKAFAAEMATEMERRQQAERFAILDRAQVPQKPVKPNRPMFMGVGCFLSLALGLAAGIGREFRKHAVLGEWELGSDCAILGRVPKMDPIGEGSLLREGAF